MGVQQGESSTTSKILSYQGAGLKYVLLRLRDDKFCGKEDWFDAHKPSERTAYARLK